MLAAGRKIQIDRTKPFNSYYLSGGVFVIMTILSTYLATYQTCAIVGGPTRFEGLGVIICYVMIMFYTMILLDEAKYFHWIVGCFTLLIIAQAVIGIFQYIGYDPLHWAGIRELVAPGDFGQNYYFADGKEPLFMHTEPGFMQGTLGNRNYTGSMVALATPFFLTLTCLRTQPKARLLYGVTTLLSLFMIIASRSRAGMVGIGLSLFVALILFCKSLPTLTSWCQQQLVRNKRLTLTGLTGIVVISAATLFFIGQTGQLTRLFNDMGTLIGLSAPAPTQLPATAGPPRAFTYTKDTLVIQTASGRPLEVYLSPDGAPSFSTEGHAITYTYVGEDVDAYVLGGKALTTFDLRPSQYDVQLFRKLFTANPFRAYRFKIGHDGDDRLLTLFHGDRAVCGFRFGPDGTVIPTNYWNFAPLDNVDAPSLGFEGKENVGSNRGYIWSRTLPMLGKAMVLGYGPDTFMLEFPQRDYWGKLKSFSNIFTCVDKPHNTYLQIWFNQGFIALVAFLVIAFTYVRHSFKLYGFKRRYSDHEALGIALMLAIIGYLGASFFNDTTLSVTPIFWALLGTGIAYNRFYKKQIQALQDTKSR
ncbi:MAG: O-antigen ligase family protein [Cellulosilyticaceae bacterium]